MEKQPMLYAQRTLDFETPGNAEAAHVAEQTSEPPPADQARQAPPHVRPDRQLTYEGTPHYEWPDPTPLHDGDTITVDRLRDDIDGPSHRFLIKRGDRVEAWLGTNNLQEGIVVGISHARQEVRVCFCEGTDGQWFSKGQIYPAIESKSERPKSGQPLSTLIAAVNDKHGMGLTEADRVPPPSFSFCSSAITSSVPRFPSPDFASRPRFRRQILVSEGLSPNATHFGFSGGGFGCFATFCCFMNFVDLGRLG